MNSNSNYNDLFSISLHERIELKGLIMSKADRVRLFGINEDIEQYFKGLMGVYLTGKGGLYNAILIHLNIDTIETSGRKVNEMTKELLKLNTNDAKSL